MLIISALGKWRQGLQKFKIILGYTVSLSQPGLCEAHTHTHTLENKYLQRRPEAIRKQDNPPFGHELCLPGLQGSAIDTVSEPSSVNTGKQMPAPGHF